MCHFVLRSQAHIDTMQESPIFLIVRASDRPNFLQDLYDQELTPPIQLSVTADTCACLQLCKAGACCRQGLMDENLYFPLFHFCLLQRNTHPREIVLLLTTDSRQENICPLVEYIGFLNSDHCVFINFQGRCSISTHPCSLLLRVQMPTSKP